MAELLAGRYELVDRLGIRGVLDPEADPAAGAGVSDAVWRAWDHKAGTYVAAKVMPHGSAATLLRFVREVAPRLRHRRVVVPTGWAGVGNLVLFTMPLIRGGSAAHLAAEVGPLPVQWMATLLDQLLDALARAHAADVVHGDIRAERLLLEPNGHGAPQLRLAGFGCRPASGDQFDDLSAVGAMLAGLLVGLGGYERVATSENLEHSAPLGIPAVFWDLLTQLTDGDLTAEQARTELVQTGCLPDDWSLVHDDAIVETVDTLPPYPAGWGPRGPIAFAPPGFVRNDLPPPLDDQPAASERTPWAHTETAPSVEDHSSVDAVTAGAELGQRDTASREAEESASVEAEAGALSGDREATGEDAASQDIAVQQNAGADRAKEQAGAIEQGLAEESLFADLDEDDDPGTDQHAAKGPRSHQDGSDQRESSEAPGSALAALLREDGESLNDQASEQQKVPEPTERPEDRYGSVPELELEPQRRWPLGRDGQQRRRLPSRTSMISWISALFGGFRAPRVLRFRRSRSTRQSSPSFTPTPSAASPSPTQRPSPDAGPRLPQPRTAESQHDEADWPRPVRRFSIGSVVRLPTLPTLGPRQAESLRAVGIGSLLVGGGLVMVAFVVLFFG